MLDDATFEDVTDAFDFLPDGLEYYDAPLAGFLKHKATGRLFAFECTAVVTQRVFHWVLVPVASAGGDASGLVRSHLTEAIGAWGSILEDRRTRHGVCRLVWMAPGNKVVG